MNEFNLACDGTLSITYLIATFTCASKQLATDALSLLLHAMPSSIIFICSGPPHLCVCCIPPELEGLLRGDFVKVLFDQISLCLLLSLSLLRLAKQLLTLADLLFLLAKLLEINVQTAGPDAILDISFLASWVIRARRSFLNLLEVAATLLNLLD